jgi:RNA polymerase sigma-70 factor (ECF subfamily)
MNTDRADRQNQALKQVESAYAEFGGGLFRFALRISGNRDDAEDIVVETFTNAYHQWHTFKGKASRRTWLYGIAMNCFRMSRRNQRLTMVSLDENIAMPRMRSVDSISLQQEIDRLPLRHREAFLLVKSEGLTTREAAEVLHRPLGTVLYEVHSAMHALRKGLRGDEIDCGSVPSALRSNHEM